MDRLQIQGWRLTGGALLFALMAPAGWNTAWADTVQLANGDSLTGQVVSLDEQKLKLHSEVIGDLTIERKKISAIYFGDAKPPVARPVGPGGVIPGKVGGGDAGAGILTAEDILQQLKRAGGLNPGSLEDLQKQLPLLGQPEVQAYFQDTVGGLLSGKVAIDDLRKQAIDAREQVRELEAELVPGSAEALQPYTKILDKFIRESAPMAPSAGGGTLPPVAPIAVPKVPVPKK